MNGVYDAFRPQPWDASFNMFGQITEISAK